jgi:myosin protein heavy chain
VRLRIVTDCLFQSLERQLTAAQEKYRDFEDVVLEIQRDKEIRSRDLETTRKQLETESAKRTQLEKTASTQKSEIAKLKERNSKFEKDLNKTITELKEREWEVKQLLSKQDKTIVEHVHVLEEAKRVTDRQLADAQKELQKNAVYIRSLLQAKSKMSGEAEDLALKYESELRFKENEIKAQEKKLVAALAQSEKERRSKEESELQTTRVHRELQQVKQQADDLAEQLVAVKRSKDALEGELDRLVDDVDNGDSLANLQRQYESRIAQLETQLDESEMSRVTSTRIRDQIERQHAEIRQLVMSSSPADRDFHSRLLREFQHAEDVLQKELSVRPRNPRLSGANELRPMSANSTPRKSTNNFRPTGQVDSPRSSDKQVAALKQQVQLLEIQMVASERVRRHLEASVRELTAELDNSDGSKQFLERYKARLVQENARLSELLKEEAEARRTTEASQVDGVQAMWSKFQKTISEERESYSRLEESRKALVSLRWQR